MPVGWITLVSHCWSWAHSFHGCTTRFTALLSHGSSISLLYVCWVSLLSLWPSGTDSPPLAIGPHVQVTFSPATPEYCTCLIDFRCFLNHFSSYLGVFLGLGLSGLIPTMHFTIAEGFVKATTVGQMGWFYLMGAMYVSGAGLYAARIPERYFPGKCDIWVRLRVSLSCM